jgi:hypothetical protein
MDKEVLLRLLHVRSAPEETITLKGDIMARRAFYSFHYIPDNWRASQIKKIGVVDSNKPATDNDWEAIKKKGDAAIREWIEKAIEIRGEYA